jgi:uncharacterized membrane protein
MDVDNSERDQVEARFRTLEARIAVLEATLRAASRAGAAAQAKTRPAPPMPPPVVPAAPPPVVWNTAAPRARPAAPATWPPPAARSAPGLGWAEVIANLEEQLTGRALAVVGGAALVAAAIFFLSLAFGRGWIGAEGRVIIGLVAAAVSLALGGWLLERNQAVVGRVLVGVGLATVSLSMFAATRLYGLIPTEIALLATLAAAIATASIAIRYDAQIIAALSLVAVLGAPPILGATPNTVTIAYIGTVLVGFAALALHRSWRWLPSIAFVLSAPQLASWLVGNGSPAIGLAAAACFWGLNMVTAGGEEYLRAQKRLQTGSATLLVANAAYLVWAGFTVLEGPYEPARGAFLVLAALAHALVAGWFLVRQGDRHPFGLLVAGTGVALLAIAAPVQLGAPAVPVAWAAEATVLAWLAARRTHPQAAVAAATLGLVALLHLLSFEYPLRGVPRAGQTGWPFINASGLTLAFMLGAAAAAGWFVRARGVVSIIAALATLAVADAMWHELAGPAVVGAWVALALAAIALDRVVIERLPIEGPIPIVLPPPVRYALLAAAVAVAVAILDQLLRVQLPIADVGRIIPPEVPFTDDRALTLVFAVAGAAFAGWVYQGRMTFELPAVASLVSAGLILAYGSTFEVYADASIVIAAVLAAFGFVLGTIDGVDRQGWSLATTAASCLIGVATVAAIAIVAPPSLLVVSGTVQVHHVPYVSGATATLGALAGALAVAAQVNPRERFSAWAGLAAGVLMVYLLSIGVVDAFQARVGGPVTLEELAFQAQVALSLLWIVLGTVVFVFGLARRRLLVRQAGLALLALASLKVFLVDLSSLDVAYRVLSLFALGTLLLLTAWAYARLRPPPPIPPDAETEPKAA